VGLPSSMWARAALPPRPLGVIPHTDILRLFRLGNHPDRLLSQIWIKPPASHDSARNLTVVTGGHADVVALNARGVLQLTKVRYWGKTGRHMLTLVITSFDPLRSRIAM
jgi:hypothetical protein